MSPKSASSDPKMGQNKVKMQCFGRQSFASGPIRLKHQKLKLPQRVEVVSTQRKHQNRNILAKKRHFRPKSGAQTPQRGGSRHPLGGQMGVTGAEKSIFQNRSQITSRWSEKRFEASRRPDQPPGRPKRVSRTPQNHTTSRPTAGQK